MNGQKVPRRRLIRWIGFVVFNLVLMHAADIKALLDARISRERAKELLIALVKVPSPQTELLEDEPLLKEFIKTAVEPRLRAMGFADIRYDTMGNLIATCGAGTSGKSLMFIGNAMVTPCAGASPRPNRADASSRPRRRRRDRCGCPEDKAVRPRSRAWRARSRL